VVSGGAGREQLGERGQAASAAAPTGREPGGRRTAADVLLEARGFRRCEHCDGVMPLHVSRHRSRRCPGYSTTWARDTMRKIRENLRAYGGMTCVIAITAPGAADGLVWDRSICTHTPGEECSGTKGCRVKSGAAVIWNEYSRRGWRDLNRVSKQRADRAIRRLGATTKLGLLMYEWEVQKRGVWHLHIVLPMETAIERAWSFAYVEALSELAPRRWFGFVDRKPLRAPRTAESAASYLSKYLAKWQEDGTLEITETVKSAGRSLLNYVSRNLTARSCVTMRNLRNARVIWAWLEGHIGEPTHLDDWDILVAVCLLDHLPVPSRAP
jgi:hypothetical protein